MWVYEFLHVLVGILWIGLLYFFNLVQVQSMPKMTEAGAAKPYTQIILPKALFLFRHAALWTVITGLVYFMAGMGKVEGIPSPEIYMGMVLGIIMAGNVWFIIWPNQKKIIAGELEGDALAKAKRHAFLASRTNAWLSLPMLVGMVSASHGGLAF
ncbi:MAG: urate hydroxylase PuuD [Nitrospinales bacterium]